MTNISKGEQKLINLFTKNRINFKREVIFEDLVGKKKVPLRFDFGLYKNNKLICLIDYDGKQHFEYVPYFHKNRYGFLQSKERDRIKNKYCILHHIPFIRIPYWDFDNITIQSILTNPNYIVKDKFHNDRLMNNRG